MTKDATGICSIYRLYDLWVYIISFRHLSYNENITCSDHEKLRHA